MGIFLYPIFFFTEEEEEEEEEEQGLHSTLFGYFNFSPGRFVKFTFYTQLKLKCINFLKIGHRTRSGA
jgi:hypothetical protein